MEEVKYSICVSALQKKYKEYSARAAAYGQSNDPRLVDALAACKQILEEMKHWS